MQQVVDLLEEYSLDQEDMDTIVSMSTLKVWICSLSLVFSDVEHDVKVGFIFCLLIDKRDHCACSRILDASFSFKPFGIWWRGLLRTMLKYEFLLFHGILLSSE